MSNRQEYYIKNREKILAYKRKHYLENKDRLLKYKKEHYNGSSYYKNNREEILRKVKEYQKKHPGYCKLWYEKNKEKKKGYTNQWQWKYPNKYKPVTKKKKKKTPEEKKEQRRSYRKNNQEKIRERGRQYRENNREKIREINKRYRKNNPEKVKEKNRLWAKNNPEKVRESKRKRLSKKRATDLKYNLSKNISRAIRLSLNNNSKAGRHWEDIVGYSLGSLIKRLKKTLPKGYTWDDYNNGKLHIDHIVPISAHNYTKPENPDFKKCWALKNLRLLPAKENIAKGAKLSKPFQPALKLFLIS